jgi:DNA-binding HxlR family transcriptional regulator
MVLIRMSADDVALTRFATSPLGETVEAVRVLLDPGVHAVHLPWVRWAQASLAHDPIDLGVLPALLPARAARPGFLTPAPDTRLPDFDTELAGLRRTRPADVRASLTRTFAAPPRFPGPLRALHDDPRHELPRLTGTLHQLWTRLIAPHWPRIARVLDADIVHRSRRLADHGIGGLAADLHPQIMWTSDGLVLPWTVPEGEPLVGEGGLVLVPSVFGWPRVLIKWRPQPRTTLRYPVRGVAAIWEHPPRPTDTALIRLLGRPRATILHHLAAPATTAELARRLNVTPSAVSQHLRDLHAARLVARERQGRSVLYLRTTIADALCAPECQPADAGLT